LRTVVCIKQVPDPAQAKIDKETGTVIRSGVDKILNPFDSYAIEEGLRLKEKMGGEVIALSMGPESAAEVIREALGMGVDRGVLLSHRDFAASDTWATSYALSCAVKTLADVDLIICGRQAIDGDTAQVGPELAEHLGIPHATDVCNNEEITEDKLVVKRLVEDGYEVLEMPLPALITVVKDINEPRMPSLKNMMRARKAGITVWGPSDIGANTGKIGLQGSPTRVARTFEPERNGGGQILTGSPAELSSSLVEFLRSAGLIYS